MDARASPDAASAIRDVIHTRIAACEPNTFGFGSNMKRVIRRSVQEIPAPSRSDFEYELRDQLLNKSTKSSLVSEFKGLLSDGPKRTGGWSMGTSWPIVFDLKDICVQGGVRFEDTAVQRTFVDIYHNRLLHLRATTDATMDGPDADCSVNQKKHHSNEGERSATGSDGSASDSSGANGYVSDNYESDEWLTSSDDRDGGLPHLDMCASARVADIDGVLFSATTWCNGIVTCASFPYDEHGGRYPEFTTANRDSAVANLFRTGLSQIIAQLLAANEMCGAWLGAFILGTKFSRIMVLDASTVLLEIRRIPRPVMWKRPQSENLYPSQPDDDSGEMDSILSIKNFLGHKAASVDHMAYDLASGWIDTNWSSPVQLDEVALQALLDFFGAAILDIADASVTQPLRSPSTSHRSGPYLCSVAEAVEQWKSHTDTPDLVSEKTEAEELDMHRPETAIGPGDCNRVNQRSGGGVSHGPTNGGSDHNLGSTSGGEEIGTAAGNGVGLENISCKARVDADSLLPSDSISERDELVVEYGELNAADVVLHLPVVLVLVSPSEMDTALLERATVPPDVISREPGHSAPS